MCRMGIYCVLMCHMGFPVNQGVSDRGLLYINVLDGVRCALICWIGVNCVLMCRMGVCGVLMCWMGVCCVLMCRMGVCGVLMLEADMALLHQ